MTAYWSKKSKKLDPYWSIEDMMKTNKGILSHLTVVNNLNTECYGIQIKKMKTKVANSFGSVKLH